MSYVLIATPAAADRPETKQTNREVPTTTIETKELTRQAVSELLPPPAIPAGVTQEDMIKWQKVAICEQGGNWRVQGPIFSGGLGFRNYVWLAYGGGQYAPNAGLATPQQQVAIAKKINGNYVPDQNGCSGSW
jgi:hypothetical protein